MAKFKLGAIEDVKPVRLTIELPAALHRDLVAYAEVLARETAQETIEPAKLIAPMIVRFMVRPPVSRNCSCCWTTPIRSFPEPHLVQTNLKSS